MAPSTLPPREDVWIPSQNGNALLAAWLHPAPSGKRGPAVILGHGLGATRHMGLDDYSLTFQQAGYTAIAFDYAGFGSSEGAFPRQVLDFYKQQDDWDAVIEYTRRLEYVDPDRIAVFGTSFGGGHVMYLAARDKRIAAVIAQCPFTSGFHSTMALGLVQTMQLIPLGVADYVKSFFSKIPIDVKIAGYPHERALMNAHDVMAGFEALVPKGVDFTDTTPHRDRVAARFVLQIPFLTPGAYAKNVKCPMHVAICTTDTVAPPGPTLAYVKQAPRVEIAQHKVGHFEIYKGDWYTKASGEYVDFLKRHLPPVTK